MVDDDKVRVNVYITKGIREQALELARELGITFSGLVNIALNDYIKQDRIKHLSSLYEQLRDLEIRQSEEKEKEEEKK